jgi:hypothetical protein
MDSYIEHGKNSTTLVGDDAMRMMRAFALASHIKLYIDTKIIPTRRIGIKRMMAMAKEITGKTYKMNPEGYRAAADDVELWAKEMRAAIPHLTREE